jgi:hypothetical protein
MSDLTETILIGILTALVADGIKESGKLAWRHRRMIVGKLRGTPEDIVVYLQPMTLRAEAQPMHVTVSDKLGISDNALTTVSKGAPSLARRLEELVSWYLHVS